MGDLNTIFITTRVSVSTTNPLNSSCYANASVATDLNCVPQPVSKSNVKTYYVAYTENITLQIDHSVRSQFESTLSSQDFAVKNSVDMKGELLYGCNATNRKIFEAADREYFYKTFGTRLDVIYLSEFLAAGACGSKQAAFSLDDQSDAANESYRSTGMVLSVEKTEYKIIQNIRNPDNTTTIYNRHGIRFVFTQTGTIGIFDLQSLLVNLVAAFALTNFASIIVEMLMLNVLPRKVFYKNVKFDEEIYDPVVHGQDAEENLIRSPASSSGRPTSI
ncbi:cytochrome c oxidase subunit 1 [Nowakowskiella sp. JEL0078]|nr:cytochrome c oxidase subunit 1 [Nowakowskiella sp. JEL0078]